MLNKLFKNRGGGSAKASIEYLLNKKEGEFRVLKGSPQLSLKLAEGLDFKRSYTVGCLSFAELGVDEEVKRSIIERFEHYFFAGLSEEQYNICWIEHTDKGRLELNYFIPNVELLSGKRLQPYYDKVDRGLSDSFCGVINYEYGLSDSHDPSLRQAACPPSIGEVREKKVLIERINTAIEKSVLEGVVNNRGDVVGFLEESGLEVLRNRSKGYIMIKDPNGIKNIRLKGAIYEQNFRNNEAYRRELSERIVEYKGEDKERYRRNIERLQSEYERRRAYHQKRYRFIERSDTRGLGERREATEETILKSESIEFVGGDEKAREQYGEDNELSSIEEFRDSEVQKRKRGLFSNSEEEGKNIRNPRRTVSNESLLRIRGSYAKEFGEQARKLLERFRGFIRGFREINKEVSGIKSSIEQRESEISGVVGEINGSIQAIGKKNKRTRGYVREVEGQVKVRGLGRDEGVDYER